MNLNWEERLLNDAIKGEKVNSKSTVNKIKSINEFNRERFLEYYDNYLIIQKSINICRGRRSKVVDFLINEDINKKRISDLTQNDIEKYFNKYIYSEKANTFTNRLDFIKHFYIFHQNIIKKILNFDNLRLSSEYINSSSDNPAEPLSCKQLEEVRIFYKKQPFKLFIFEMVYSLKILPSKLKLLTGDIYNKETLTFMLSETEKFKVPSRLSSLVDRAIETGNITKNKDYNHEIAKMRTELVKAGIRDKSFKWNDIAKTENSTFFNCPECGALIEATVDNWVSKQYHPDGTNWIVCKKYCAGGLE